MLDVKLLVVSVDIVVVARVEVPVTTKLPVVVLLVVERLVTIALRAVSKEEKNPVVEVALVATRLLVMRLLETVRLVVDALESIV